MVYPRSFIQNGDCPAGFRPVAHSVSIFHIGFHPPLEKSPLASVKALLKSTVQCERFKIAISSPSDCLHLAIRTTAGCKPEMAILYESLFHKSPCVLPLPLFYLRVARSFTSGLGIGLLKSMRRTLSRELNLNLLPTLLLALETLSPLVQALTPCHCLSSSSTRPA